MGSGHVFFDDSGKRCITENWIGLIGSSGALIFHEFWPLESGNSGQLMHIGYCEAATAAAAATVSRVIRFFRVVRSMSIDPMHPYGTKCDWVHRFTTRLDPTL